MAWSEWVVKSFKIFEAFKMDNDGWNLSKFIPLEIQNTKIIAKLEGDWQVRQLVFCK